MICISSYKYLLFSVFSVIFCYIFCFLFSVFCYSFLFSVIFCFLLLVPRRSGEGYDPLSRRYLGKQPIP